MTDGIRNITDLLSKANPRASIEGCEDEGVLAEIFLLTLIEETIRIELECY